MINFYYRLKGLHGLVVSTSVLNSSAEDRRTGLISLLLYSLHESRVFFKIYVTIMYGGVVCSFDEYL